MIVILVTQRVLNSMNEKLVSYWFVFKTTKTLMAETWNQTKVQNLLTGKDHSIILIPIQALTFYWQFRNSKCWANLATGHGNNVGNFFQASRNIVCNEWLGRLRSHFHIDSLHPGYGWHFLPGLLLKLNSPKCKSISVTAQNSCLQIFTRLKNIYFFLFSSEVHVPCPSLGKPAL